MAASLCISILVRSNVTTSTPCLLKKAATFGATAPFIPVITAFMFTPPRSFGTYSWVELSPDSSSPSSANFAFIVGLFLVSLLIVTS